MLYAGVALDRKQAKITISDIPDKPGAAAKVFNALGDAKILVDMIIQNIGRGGVANMTFTVNEDEVHRAADAVQAALDELGGGCGKAHWQCR